MLKSPSSKPLRRMDNNDQSNEHDLLITETKVLAGMLNFSVENHKNLKAIKGSEELVRKLKDLFSDFDEHEEKLRLTIHTSSYVYRNLVSLQTSMQDVSKFLIELSSARILFFSKTKIKNKLYNILHSLRAKNTQLLTSVTLELLSRAQKPDLSAKIPPVTSNTLEFDAGFAHYHGICRPKNFTRAVESFKEAAKKGDAEAMLMLAECYSEERGLEKDEHLSSEWIDKAAQLGCPGALHKKAMQTLRGLEFSHPDEVSKALNNFEDTYESGFGDMDLGSVMDDSLSPTRSIRGRGESQSPSRGKSTEDGANKSNERQRDRSTERDIERQMRNGSTASHDDRMDRDDEEDENLQCAMQLLLQSAEKDFVGAKTDLGILFEMASDHEKAFKWFTLASCGGCPKATNRLGLLYFHGKGATQHLERAFSLFISAAKSGDRDANNNAGSCLEQGLGTEMRPAAAMSYYLRGAEMDSPQAMYSLGYLLIRSSVKALEDLKVASEMQMAHTYREQWEKRGGVPLLTDRVSPVSNIPRGTVGSHRGPNGSGKMPIDTLAMATSQSAGIAAVDLSSSTREDSGKPRKPLRPFSVPHNSNLYSSSSYSNKGVASLRSSMGNGISNSTAPVNISKTLNDLSLSLVLPSRSNESHTGNEDLATESLEAQQVKAQHQVREGVRWLRAAAERGVLDARYQLGLVYEQGIGCPSDLHSALAQYEYAAMEGHAKAAVTAGNILYDKLQREHPSSLDNSPSTHDSSIGARYRKIVDLYRIAAVGGIADAMNCLGLLLEDGRGCQDQRPDTLEAVGWYVEACMSGKKDAAVNLALLLSRDAPSNMRPLGTNQHVSLAEAIHWLEEYRAESDIPEGLWNQLDNLLYHMGGRNFSSTSLRSTPRSSCDDLFRSRRLSYTGSGAESSPARSTGGRSRVDSHEASRERKERERGSRGDDPRERNRSTGRDGEDHLRTGNVRDRQLEMRYVHHS